MGVSCLSSANRMDEGWSDFFALVLSVESGDEGTDRRGVGTYAQRQETTGSGVRRFPYSTDMNTNPLTYGDIVIQGVHETGAVWTAVLWDLYWAMSEEHGWDPDVYNGTGGNNMTIQLVMDGLKMTACRPGFIDARDAILAADEVNYGGANQCLIWEVFARRGIGFSADQGDTQNKDAFEAFDEPPTCIKTLKIAKAVTDMVNPGEDVNVTLTIRNDTEEAVSGIFVTDELPLGTSYRAGSASITPNEDSGVDRMSFLIEELASGAIQTITYTLGTDASKMSIRQFFDGGEDGDDIWLYICLLYTSPSPRDLSTSRMPSSA